MSTDKIEEESWVVGHKLWKLFCSNEKRSDDRVSRVGVLGFLKEFEKMKLLDLNTEAVLEVLNEEETLTWEAFRCAAGGLSRAALEAKATATIKRSKEDGKEMPERFQNPETFHWNVSSQHPCYNTSAHEIGKKLPQSVDMPMRWHGAAGEFTKAFEMDTPGKGTTINQYRNRGLKTSKTFSKVHTQYDVDW